MSIPSFISVQKVVVDKDGQIKKSPDTIRLDWLKSARPWKKNKRESEAIKEEMTILYMVNPYDKDPEDDASDDINTTDLKGVRRKKAKDDVVKIAESKEDFDSRINAIKERQSSENVVIKRLGRDE